ncbi:hypothetical protein A2G96_07795 [Cupriavidus nantongensis]|uniref:Uncharacterized protein n=1 Tax=Cupriavidus nantongensis TaxID=1796606 RepID=A0A142JHT3_9BURK|nr:hypothetical protein A2G96_07795 [Cupriavidus nantongensis]
MAEQSAFPSASDIEAALARRATKFVCPMCHHENWSAISGKDFRLTIGWQRMFSPDSSPESRHTPVSGLTCLTCGFVAHFLPETFRKFIYGGN